MKSALLGVAVAPFVLLALTLAAAPASAHGPAPAVLEVLAIDEDGPTWLRSSVGLLRRSADGTWEHVCPALWDGNDRARAAVAGDDVLVLSGEAYRNEGDRCGAWESLAAPVRAVGSDPATDALLWLEEREGVIVLRSDAGLDVPVPIASPGSMVARGGRVAVAGRTGVAVYDAGTWTEVALPERPRAVRALVGGLVFTAASVEAGLVLERIAPAEAVVDEIVTAEQLLGPVRVGGTLRMIADGLWLEARADGTVTEQGDAAGWTCLQEAFPVSDPTQPAVFACSLEGLYGLGGGSGERPLATLVFRFVQLGPSDCEACEGDWGHYAGEAGWLGTAPSSEPDGERRPIEGGCAAAGRPSAGAIGALLLGALTRRRRRS